MLWENRCVALTSGVFGGCFGVINPYRWLTPHFCKTLTASESVGCSLVAHPSLPSSSVYKRERE